jgi:hypothetical protein
MHPGIPTLILQPLSPLNFVDSRSSRPVMLSEHLGGDDSSSSSTVLLENWERAEAAAAAAAASDEQGGSNPPATLNAAIAAGNYVTL